MGVIFDLDGTLINSRSFHAKKLKIAIDSVLGNNSIHYAEILKGIRDPSSIFFRRIAERHKLKLTDPIIKNIMTIKDASFTREEVKKIGFFDGAIKLVEFLHSVNVKTCIATSMNSRELSVVDPVLRLKKQVGSLVNSKSFELEKPNPYILNLAMEVCWMKREKTIYIGDSIYDAMAANAAGIMFAGIFNGDLRKYSKVYTGFSGLNGFFERNFRKFLD